MKKFNTKALFFFLFLPFIFKAQCLQVQSILVDACVPGGGCVNSQSPNCSCEGKNEMVLFKVGNAPLTVSNLSATWPNNSFRGWAQNAGTASNVTNLNATIVSCGYLVEPVGGVLPANSSVLIITSWDMCPTANSFANLQDTLIVLFQDTGNYQGHFANHNNSGTITTVPTGTVALRTLTLNYPPLTCSESVTYDRSLLVNAFGTYGGTSAQNDGSAVQFDSTGNPTYVNDGCKAPYIPINVNAGPDTSVCFNASVNISGSVSGPYTSYSWSGGTGTFGSAGSLNTTYTPGTGESGTVMIYLNALGKCSTGVLDSFALNVIASPTPTITGANAVCIGDSIVLSVNQQSNTTYTWSTGSSATSVTVSPAAQTVYSVTASNACASASTDFTVSVNPLPVISATNDSVCPATTATLSVSGANTYTWSGGSTGSTFTASPSSTTQYTVTGTDANGCDGQATAEIFVYTPSVITVNSASICPAGGATLTAGGAQTYTWNTSQTADSIIVHPAGTTNYTVTGSDLNGCLSSAVSTVTVFNQPVITVNSASVCPGGTATLTASGAATYTWSTSQAGATITVTANTNSSYTVVGTDVNGCMSFSVANVVMNPLPLVSASNTTTCAGVNTNVTAAGANTYTWSTLQTGAAVTVPGVAATYTVVGENVYGCLDTAVAAVTLLPAAQPQAISGDTIICLNQTTVLTAPASTYTYSWSGPGGTSGSGTTFTAGQAGVYTLTASNACGSAVSLLNVSVSTPTATFSPFATTLNTPATFTFSNTSSGNQLSNYWNLGNGDTTSVLNPVATYSAEGSYDVLLIVTDIYGCPDTAFYTLYVTDSVPPMIIPNIFSPNGDNINELFTITAKGLVQFNCKIFDRWGLLLYEWEDINLGWDGKNKANGQKVSDGTYYYLITYVDKKNKVGVVPGYLELVR